MSRRSLGLRIFGTIVFVIVVVLFGALIYSAFQNNGKPLDTFVPNGPSAQEIQNLVLPVFAIAGVVFVGVMGAVPGGRGGKAILYDRSAGPRRRR